ncbi:hypothetical protein E1200_16220 [Actinomadura sp. GC306]|uniref:hypothetical protein n=1 Tax=Actinomadura sp. GC306 TaxID=2530367 RepID=UPI00105205B9|nr:hypothetical protein [Actinomadura sp. GC306]TDC66722.1 hypothetical protein E1200_16220 [Actinomadura sp. GC306]
MTEAVSAVPGSAASVPPAAPRLAFGIGPDGTYTALGQAAAFVLGVLTMFAFLPLMIVAALLYTKAETVFPEDPARARRLVDWSWLCITVPVAFAALIGVAVLLERLVG